MDTTLEKLLENSKKTRALHPDDIPELDLYMDQIIALMGAHLGGTDEKEPLTRTMIHNYSKAGLISPVKGKKYTKEHILQMLVIYSLKNTLTIAQIKRVLYGVDQQEGVGAQELAQCFSTQLAQRDAISRQLCESVDRITQENGLSVDTPADALTFLLTLTDVTDTLTRFAAALTQTCFPDPPQKKGK